MRGTRISRLLGVRMLGDDYESHHVIVFIITPVDPLEILFHFYHMGISSLSGSLPHAHTCGTAMLRSLSLSSVAAVLLFM